MIRMDDILATLSFIYVHDDFTWDPFSITFQIELIQIEFLLVEFL